ncbi:MAG: HD domain-containing protein [Alphaproteobacteria bacterium]|nr:HD domain-containing protein [Alphaproteobacteria bacterium]
MEPTRVRLAEILTSLALAIDIGLGVPMQTVHRTALIAVRLARVAGLDDEDIIATYYLAILRYVGCSTTAHATSRFVDELALGNLLVVTDEEMIPELARVLAAVMPEAQAQAAAQQMGAAFGSDGMAQHHRNHCEAAELIAKRLGLGARVVDGLTHTYERWDGVSTQKLAHGEEISLPMRVVQVAYQVGQDSISRSGVEIAERVRVRAGKQLDPTFSALIAEDPEYFLAGMYDKDLTQDVLDTEPGGPIWLTGDEIDNGLSAIADFGDFKSPHMLGHSRRVAAVAGAAARAASMPASDVAQLGHAALVHDIGRVGVQSSLLSKSGTLTRAEHERIRLHSYLTERIFAASPVLGPLGALGSAHHEKLDGSGYHHGYAAPALSAKARLLAAANAWCALTETRPHRQQMTEAEAASALSAQAKDKLFDRKAVDAVLTAAGQKGSRTRRAAAIALSEREIEVLQHVVREQTNAAIAVTLGISPKTVERHVTHIYDKLGVSTRAGAAIYALENGLS